MLGLYNLGFSDIEIKNILEIYPEIKNLTDEEILVNIEILKRIECNEKHIKNIISSNPYYLNRGLEDISGLINKLISIGITNVNLLFDSDPYLLNKDAYEIDEYIKIEQDKVKVLEDIKDEFESNPYIIDEI